MTEPICTPGPLVKGTATTITQFNPEQLRGYQYLHELKELINASFAAVHSSTEYWPTDVKRLETEDQLFSEIGPDFYTFVLSQNDENRPEPHQSSRLLASGSGRRVLPKGTLDAIAHGKTLSQIYTVQTRLANADPESVCWELKLLVTRPNCQGQGLASLLTKLVETEAVKRGISEGSQINGQAKHAPKRVRMMLFTVKRENEAYYAKRGYETKAELPMEKGTFGSLKAFEMCFMEKVLPVVV